MLNGIPIESTMILRFTPCLPLSVGFLPVSFDPATGALQIDASNESLLHPIPLTWSYFSSSFFQKASNMRRCSPKLTHLFSGSLTQDRYSA